MKFFSSLKINLKKYLIGTVAIIIVIVLGSMWMSGGEERGFQTHVVEHRNLEQIVEGTGVVEAADEADLSFNISGGVAWILVDEGDVVERNAVLAELSNAQEYANVLSVQAQLDSAEAKLAERRRSAEGGGEALEVVKRRQDRLVGNAYTKLLSEGLIIEPSYESTTVSAPTVSGRYGGQEGTYKIIIRQGSQSGDYEISVFDLEIVRDIEISETGLTSLGTHGLFIEFSDNLSLYTNTIWYLDIPNKKSSVYLSNYNAYQEALEQREDVIENARASEYDIRVEEANVSQARANLAKAQAQYSDTILRAPFTGVVIDLAMSAGEAVSAAKPVISLISEGAYRIKASVSEADIASVDVGNSAVVTFDAYDDEEFFAHVSFIAPSAKTVDGVSIFDVTFLFNEQDPRIKRGLSADVEIIAETRDDVLAVPSRAVIRERDGQRFVRILEEGTLVTRVVETGLRSSDGFVEIISGLEVGEEVIISTGEEDRQEI